MDLLSGINRSGKSDTIIKTLVWNSVKEAFMEEKNMDISPYLISVIIKKDTYIIKTNKPVVNAEAYFIVDKIKNKILQKMIKIGIKNSDFEVKFI